MKVRKWQILIVGYFLFCATVLTALEKLSRRWRTCDSDVNCQVYVSKVR